MINSIDTRSYAELQSALELAQYTVYKKYLNELIAYPLVAPSDIILDEKPKDCLRLFQLEELTCKKGEDIFQKLSTVYHASMSLGCSLFVMIDVEHINAAAKIYLGIRNSNPNTKSLLVTSYNALQGGLKSNFPGTKISNISASETLKEKVEDIFASDVKCISAVSGVASIRGKDKTENKDFIQGLEKLIDAMQGHTYTAIFIADPITAQEQDEIRNGYENLYSTLSPFQKSQWSYNENESKTVMESLSNGISHSVTKGISQTQSHTVASTKGTFNSVNIGINGGINRQNTSGVSNSHTEGTNNTAPSKAAQGSRLLGLGAKAAGTISVMATATGMIALVVPGAQAVAPAAMSIAKVAKTASVAMGTASAVGGAVHEGESVTNAISDTITQSVGKSMGMNVGGNIGYTHGWSSSETISDGDAKTASYNDTNTTSETKTTGSSETKGNGKTLQIENINKPVAELLKRIEEQLKRVQEEEDYGAYNCGAYFLSSKEEDSILAANTYRALMLGEGASIESGAINTWTDKAIIPQMKEYLKRFEQPVFALPIENDVFMYSAGTVVSGLELPLHLGIPTKSIIGLPVIEHAEFGRNVRKAEYTIELGKLYHMGCADEHKIALERESFSLHTFITGSTGTGKSNTVYHLLNELNKNHVKFLVVEPAKGEYKNIFGGRKDVTVYGTNAKKADLLQINPFTFQEETHVLEHIDRLVEIFNACWPMYAAMPAVLKDAIERAYRNCGWNMEESECVPKIFPTFHDLLQVLPDVVKESSYSADTQSDYIGALYTRIKSLTNGINGQIFCSQKEISAQKLFDENVIVDLSRVGSTETKALLMGILVMKLQEYRMEQKNMNADLCHVTVLEEAHNLLRRTNDVQTQDSSNLQGKSVEMLANAIAEMRTYGEGFIIADQAPTLLDTSVIRNTNTKIILRLPEENDRQLVGKSASLNDNQIDELAKLPLGVAAVYQNDWLEPILCQIEEFCDRMPYKYQKQADKKVFLQHLCKYLYVGSDNREFTKEDADNVKAWINISGLDSNTKRLIWRAASFEKLSDAETKQIAYNLFNGKHFAITLEKAMDEKFAIEQIDRQINEMYHLENMNLAQNIREQILNLIIEQLGNSKFSERYLEFCGRRIC